MSQDSGLRRLEGALSALFSETASVHRVLSAGCGDFAEARVLRRVFPSAALFGLDWDWSVLRRVPSAQVIAADAASMPFVATTQFDLVLVRHPDLARYQLSWQRVLMAIPKRLTAGGRLLVSCYTGQELETARASLLAGGAIVCPAPVDVPPVDLAGLDRFMTAVKSRSI